MKNELLSDILEDANVANGIKKTAEKNTSNHKGISIKEYAAAKGYKAIDRLVDIIDDYEIPASAAVSACRELLDRAFGKPTQAVEVSGEVVMVSDDELDAIYQRGMEKIEQMKVEQEQRAIELRGGALH
jgi:uncharacterized protein (UPF0147 family)